jgi:beta-aspartyl-peptidase (threonine type)
MPTIARAQYRALARANSSSAKAVLDEVHAMGGTGGVIVAAPDGTAAWHFTTPGMYRARLSSDGAREIGVFGQA